MTDQRELDRLLDAYFVEGSDELADRVINAALDDIDHTEQRRASRMPRRFSTMNTYSRIAAAAVIGVLAVGGTLYALRPVQSPASKPDFVASPGSGVAISPSPSQPVSTPSLSPDPCLTFEIRTAAELTDIDGDPSTGIGSARGVFLAGSTLFAAGPGPARAIAEVTPSNGGSVEVLDLSADGSTALIRAGFIGGGNSDPECADLLTVRTDGSSVVRLTSLGAGRIVAAAAFSPDATRVAYSSLEPGSSPHGSVSVLDLGSRRTVDQPCGSSFVGDSAVQIDWSPTGDMVSLICGVLTIFDATGTAAQLEFPAIGDAWAFHWTDRGHLVVVDKAGDLRTVDVASQASRIIGSVDETKAEFVLLSGVFSPDGQWLAYVGSHQDGSYATYVTPTSGGNPTQILGEDDGFVAWSADSRALICTTDGNLDRVDLDTLERSTVASIANYTMGVRYRQGVWRIP